MDVQRGQTLIVFTIVCAFVLLGTMALVGNTQVLFVNADRADSAALLAAQAGASAIDLSELYTHNRVALNVDDAQKRCRQAGNSQPLVVSTDCSVDIPSNTVTAVVVQRVQLPMPLWSDFETVRATRSARPAYGGAAGGF
ncbi:MAG TPA: hypothetical protein VE953_13405 [Terriglobales bacterium]|nr:hypothetical protein [Terriglobales bacterium]